MFTASSLHSPSSPHILFLLLVILNRCQVLSLPPFFFLILFSYFIFSSSLSVIFLKVLSCLFFYSLSFIPAFRFGNVPSPLAPPPPPDLPAPPFSLALRAQGVATYRRRPLASTCEGGKLELKCCRSA